jgi:hypothetical protein
MRNIFILQINESPGEIPCWVNRQAYATYGLAEGGLEYYTDSQGIDASQLRIDTVEMLEEDD